MKKILLILYIILCAISLQANDAILKISPKKQKMPPKLSRLLNAEPGKKIKIWILLTDKEIFNQAALKASIADLENRFTSRAVERRLKRTDNTEIFTFSDIPVSGNYIYELESLGAEIVHQSRWLNAVSAYADLQIINAISRLPFVAEIKPVAKGIKIPEPDIDIHPKPRKIYGDLPDSVQDFYGLSYAQVQQINVPLLHQMGFTGTGVLIGLFDTGFDLDHPVFDSLNLIDKYDFINNDTLVGDTFPPFSSRQQPEHGTNTLSVIGGFSEGTLIGTAFDADYILAKTEINREEIEAEEDNWVAAAEWADSLGVDIISSSLGYLDWYEFSDLDGHTALITIAADTAHSKGISVVNSAGNEGNKAWEKIVPPSDGEKVIAVGAVNSQGERVSFSSVGPTFDGRIKPEVVAMGQSVYVADYRTGGYTYNNGTSFACPLIAGALAVILQANPGWSPDELREALLKSSDRFENPDTLYGYGLPDIYKAADIFRFDPVEPVIIAVGDSLNLQISVAGVEDIDLDSVRFSATNLPLSAEIDSLGNGLFALRYKAVSDDIGNRIIVLSATVGMASIRTNLSFTVLSGANLTAGPNPFSDSVTVFLGTGTGKIEDFSVYSVNGEKIWDSFSDTYNRGAAVIVWKGVNNSGLEVADGVYLIYVRTEVSEHRMKVFKR